ncbi:MAG TPA: sulfotransferase [Dyella sp.]|uniref:sulfotransferase n=1 Tax=Dyella sp. TaxID=1869338 RepID=UPI002CD0A2C1|nr:sulfotransferase [Dyella sp.]HTV83777.1 sulfotransferase [Dyella sp.]
MRDAVIAMPRRVFQWFRGQSLPAKAVAHEPVRDVPAASIRSVELDAIGPQGLFVIGAARSGTTVMQNALNDSREIFLFGEPVFHEDPGTPDFAARYNGKHRGWGNQENKSSFCPPLFEGDAPWFAYLCRLAAMYRYVGSKLVVNPHRAQENCQAIFDFHCRYFYRAHYVFTFRNPIDVLMSTRGLAQLNGDTAADYETVLRSFVHVAGLYIRMLRNLPAVSAVFHENVGEAVFRDLGQELGVDLSAAVRYYDTQRVRHYTLDDIPAPVRGAAEAVIGLYENLREQALAGFKSIQLEQNSKHLDARHFTPLGALQREVEQLLARL